MQHQQYRDFLKQCHPHTASSPHSGILRQCHPYRVIPTQCHSHRKEGTLNREGTTPCVSGYLSRCFNASAVHAQLQSAGMMTCLKTLRS